MSDVREKQIDLTRRLRHELGSDFVVVAAPDHPLVLRSVDVLVGGRSGLTAFMMQSAEERRRPALFETRLTLNRVALPPETQFIYIASGQDPELSIRGRFSEQLSAADRSIIKDAVKLVSSANLPQPSAPADKARRLSQGRFAATYRLARLVNSKRFNREDNLDAALGGRNLTFDFIGTVPSAFARRPISTRSLIGLSVRGADRWFEPTDEQPLPVNASAGLIFSPDFPRPRHDPEKALRATAFAGWILAPRASSRTPDELAELAVRFTSPQ